jgi:hypothetical protein
MQLVLPLEGRTVVLGEVGLVAVTFGGIPLPVGAIQIIMVEEAVVDMEGLQAGMVVEATVLG